MLAIADGIGNNELARQRRMDRVMVGKWRNQCLDMSSQVKQVKERRSPDKTEPDVRLLRPMSRPAIKGTS